MFVQPLRSAEIIGAIFCLTFISLAVLITQLNHNLPELAGSPGVIDHADVWSGMDPLSHLYYWLGDLLCHQKSFHCWSIGGTQAPFCIRDMSFIIGTGIGFVYVFFTDRYLDKYRFIIAVFIAPLTLYEWIIQELTGIDLIEISFLTAIFTGFMVAVLFHSFSMIMYKRHFE